MKNIVQNIMYFILLSSVFGQNQVLYLDGIDDYVDLPQAIIDTDKFTIESWVYLNGPGGGTETQSVIYEQREDATGCNHSAIVFYAETRDSWQVERLAVRTDIECVSESFSTTPAYGEWNHYAAVVAYDVIYIYLNGALRDSAEYIHDGSFASNIHHVSLGKHTHDWSGFGYLNGMMDQVRIWGKPLNQFEILSMMNSRDLSGNETNLFAYWNFDDSTAIDLTGHGNNGQFMAGALTIESIIPTPCGDKIGDMNGDLQLNVSDVQLLVMYILGTNNDEVDLDCIDLNSDGQITIADVLILVEVIMG